MEKLTTSLHEINVKYPSEENNHGEIPDSYTSNNKKEQILLHYAENFQRQFRQLYSDRKPLLLTPLNECAIPKFICTTMRPTYLKYKELYEFDGCTSFVADYLTYEPLEIPNELPNKVVSSTLVLKEQKGNCFDYAILLASLLIGVGYDAYCVCGYASQEVCLLNLDRNICPLLQPKEEAEEEEVKEVISRYTVRPSRDLTSSFERRQAAKEQAKIEQEEQKKREEEAARLKEAEAPPPDKIHGLRIHCWVLVLMGKREVGQNFFIEPTTGETHPLDWDQYLGIEVLWNHRNYWVNMQDCSEGIQGMSYDLGDAAIWEFFFPNVEKPLLVLPGDETIIQHEDSEVIAPEDIKEDFQLPPSWISPIVITPREMENRCPKGKKTILYYRSKLEKYAEYLNHDGLVCRIIIYTDTARRNKAEVRSYFKHRKDLLISRVEKPQKYGEVVESFDHGRERSLKVHTHYDTNPLRAGNRTMEFYSYARVDGLAKREITPTEMVEHYVNRPDFLYYRHVTYEKPLKKRDTSNIKAKLKNILKVVERFHPNPAIPPNNDVAERVFFLSDNRIKVVYQLEEGRITASTREFVTPPMNPDQTILLVFDPESITSYQVDPYLKYPKDRHLFEQHEALVQARENTIDKVMQSEQENEAILNLRTQEELNTVLNISVYDVFRNEIANKHRQELEARLAEEERIRKEKEKDYLAPFLARLGDPIELDKDQMVQVAEECLKDMRTRLVDMANIIQSRFEQETEKLQRKQAWYKSKQGSLTKDEEADYVTFCNDTMFTIHILEQRLNRHKAVAPQKYVELERRLKEDPRVAYAFQ